MQKEAAWAVTNLTAGGSFVQTMHLVDCGVIEPLCELLDMNDAKVSIATNIVTVVNAYFQALHRVLCLSGRVCNVLLVTFLFQVRVVLLGGIGQILEVRLL